MTSRKPTPRRQLAIRATGYVLVTASLLGVPFSLVLASLSHPALVLLLSPGFVAIGIIGLSLSAGDKRLVLFLRRFGDESLNHAISRLARTYLRETARLITLDDARIQPVPTNLRGLSWAALPATALLLLLAMAVDFMFSAGPSPAAMMLAIIGVWTLLVLFLLALAVASLALVSRHRGRRSFRTVTDSASRHHVIAHARRLQSFWRSSTILAPIATVIGVVDREWRETVAALADICDVALVDISEPSESIRWELDELRKSPIGIVLIAQEAKLSAWWDNVSPTLDSDLRARLRQLAYGLPLATYQSAEDLVHLNLAQLLGGELPSGPIGRTRDLPEAHAVRLVTLPLAGRPHVVANQAAKWSVWIGLLSLGVALPGPVALWLALKGRRQILAAPGTYNNHGQALAGFLLGFGGTLRLVHILALVVRYWARG